AALSRQGRPHLARGPKVQGKPDRGVLGRAVLAGFQRTDRQRRNLHSSENSRLHRGRFRERLAGHAVVETARRHQQPHRSPVLQPRVADRSRTRLRSHVVRGGRVEDMTPARSCYFGAKSTILRFSGKRSFSTTGFAQRFPHCPVSTSDLSKACTSICPARPKWSIT